MCPMYLCGQNRKDAYMFLTLRIIKIVCHSERSEDREAATK
jgi:hypothetical protein